MVRVFLWLFPALFIEPEAAAGQNHKPGNPGKYKCFLTGFYNFTFACCIVSGHGLFPGVVLLPRGRIVLIR